MFPNSRLLDLYECWKRESDAGRELPVEEVCRREGCPELADELRELIRRLSRFDPTTGPHAVGSTITPTTDDTPHPVGWPDLIRFGYEILRELGRGGMGVVYQARRGDEVVALKTLRRLSPSNRDRFQREFRLVCGLAHRNLIALRELVFVDGAHFFTMEYLDGTDLSGFVAAAKRTDPAGGWDRFRGVLGELATGIAALHAAGVIHRDIKPGNVRVTATGRVVLLDFGLAAEVPAGGTTTTVGVVAGTPAYMAPEQAWGERVDPAADWFAFGAILYEILTDRWTHPGETNVILDAKRQWAADPPPPAQLRPDVPEDLNRLCVDLLVQDPHRRLTGPEVLRRLGRRVEANSTPAVDLVGRDEQLAVLGRAFAEPGDGGAVCVRIHGASGSGKSALARQFLDRVTADGAVVLRGRCYERELVPYKAFDGAIGSLAKHLCGLPGDDARALLPTQAWAVVKLFPALAQVPVFAAATRGGPDVPDPREVRRRGALALRNLFERLGETRRVVLFIDDLQWGDADSGVLLEELLRPPDAPRLMLLLCYRREDAATPMLRAVAGLAPSPGLEVVDVPVDGLAEADARALAARLLGEPGGPADAIAREASGNPFYIRMLARAARDGAAIEANVSLSRVLWDSTRALSPDERRLLELVAVAGRPIRLEVARRCLVSGSDFYAVQVGLRSGQLLRGTGLTADDVIAPYHDRVRETVLANLDSEVRRERHLQLATVLAETGEPDPEFLAVHFHGGGEPQTAAGHYARAAEAAAGKTAFDRAAELYRLAVELGDWPEVRKARLQAAEAAALVNAGRGKAAAEAYLAAAELVEQNQAIEWKRLAAEQYLFSGRLDAGLALLKELLTASGITYPSTPFGCLVGLIRSQVWLRLRGVRFRRRATVAIPARELLQIDVCGSLAQGLGVTDFIRGAYFQTQARLLALRTGETDRVSRWIAAEAMNVAVSDARQLPRANRLLDQAREVAAESPNPLPLTFVKICRGYTDFIVGRFRTSCGWFETAERELRDTCQGVTWELNTARFLHLSALSGLGEWAAVADRWPQLMRDARDRGDLYAEVNFGTVIMTLVRLAADEPDRATTELGATISRWSQQGFHFQHHYARIATLLVHLYCDRGAEAWKTVHGLDEVYRRNMLWRVQIVRIDFHLLHARAALAAARVAANPELFLRAAAKDARKLSRESAGWAKALGALMTACVQASRKPEAGPELFAEALKQLEAAELGAFAAAARYRLGERSAGEAGEGLREQAVRWLQNQRVVNPLRIIKSFAPIGRPEDRP